MRLESKTVLITGASSGLGRTMALKLSKRRNNLILTARREPLLDEVALEVVANGSRCVVATADAMDPEQCLRVIAAGREAFGRVEVAILNAGGGVATSMATAGVEEVLRLMRLNYDTLVNYLCPMIQQMRSGGGVIAHIGSPSGCFGLPKSGPYGAAKAAGRLLLESCRVELADSGIRFVTLSPGFTHTDALDPKDVPLDSLIISKERAAREMIDAIEGGRSHHMFPKRIRYLVGLGRMMPEWLRARLPGLGR